jgi:hypothetical protein
MRARPIVSDELWEVVEPLIAKVERRDRCPGLTSRRIRYRRLDVSWFAD